MHLETPDAPSPVLFGGRRSIVILLITILFAFALRVNCLDCQSLWLDEAASAYRTTLPLPTFLQDAAENLQAPGYFLLLRGWVALAGMSPFSLRYFSVFPGILMAPFAYSFAQRYLRHRPTALLAALLAAVHAAHIYYSQETRMYAVLPVLHLLMLALVLQIWRRPRRLLWWILALLEICSVYLHLFSAFMLVSLNLLLALAFYQHRATRTFLRRWISSQLLVIFTIFPWLWFTWRSGGGLPANLDASAARAASFSLQNYIGEVWSFLWTGLTGLQPRFGYWSLLLAALLTFGLIVAYLRTARQSRTAVLALVVATGGPLLLGALVWYYNPLTHPRYLLFLAGPLTILLAHALASLAAHRLLFPIAAAGLFLVLIFNGSALRASSLDPEHRRYDASALASAIARRAAPEDIVLMPPNDRSLWYYDPAPATAGNWPFAGGDQAARATQLVSLLEGHTGAFLVEYHDLYSYDLHGQVRYLLEANGRLLEQFTVDRMDVYHIALDSAAKPQMTTLNIACGPLRLMGVAYPQQAEPGDAPAVALHWRLEEDTDQTYIASARLIDGTNQLAGVDQRLLSELETSTAGWPVGTEATTYFVLPFPLGTPPLEYDLTVLLHDEGGEPLRCGEGQDAVVLGQVELATADQRAADAYQTWQDTAWQTPAVSEIAGGLSLEGYHVRPDSLRPGQPVYVTLRWRATSGMERDVHPRLLLGADGETFERESNELFTRFPTSRWRAGDLLIETREIRVPARRNPFHLQLAVEDEIVTIADLRVDLTALQWELPQGTTSLCAQFTGVGALRGYDWRTNDDDATATLTLYWQGGDNAPTNTSYTVFAQLLAPDGWVLTQDDQLPADGARTTTTWLPGEFIADEHRFILQEGRPNQARLAVGLYDLATLERVPAFDCNGERLPDDALLFEP